jgi:serine/threonine-protein kinase
MSPEQLRGQEVDTRSDIFSFGVVLYEMLAGVHPFKKDGQIETANAILSATARPLSRYTENIPILLQHTVKKMLAKEVDRRYQLIHDVRTDVGELIEGKGESISEVATGLSGASSAAGWWHRAIPWSIAVLAVVIAISIAFWSSRQSTSPPLTKFVVAPALPPGEFSGNLAVSADGRHVLYRTDTEKGDQLYLRSLDDLVEKPIPGTESALSPFFSPDGKSVGFFAGGQLKKVSLAGGSPITLCDARGLVLSGSWSPDDTIVFSALHESGVALYRVSASGGEPEILATPDLDKGELYLLPHILPGGKTVFFTIRGVAFDHQIAALSLETGEQKILIEDGRLGKYVETGHLIYEQARAGNLMAVLFDLETLEVTSGPVSVLQGVRQNIETVDYALSDEGTLVYIPTSEDSRLAWVDRDGRTQPLTEIQRSFSAPRLSPDGTRLSVEVSDEAGVPNIWIYEIARDILTPFTVEGGNFRAIWSPDGKRLIFGSIRGGTPNLFWMPIDGSAEAKQLTTGENPQHPTSWSPNGLVAYVELIPPGADIWVLPLEGEREAETVLATQFNERNAVFSPNGRWLALTSNRSGQAEVYVKPYPGQGGFVQISTDGGLEPVWAQSGKELFYRTGDQMMVVSVQTDTTFKAEKPRLLFEGSYRYNFHGVTSNYDVTADGQRFVMVKEETGQINVVLNWFQELKRLVSTDN